MLEDSAQHPPPRLPDPPAVQMGLGLALVVPVEAACVERVARGGRQVEDRAPVGGAGFEQQHGDVPILRKPRRHHRSGAAGPDHHVIGFSHGI